MIGFFHHKSMLNDKRVIKIYLIYSRLYKNNWFSYVKIFLLIKK